MKSGMLITAGLLLATTSLCRADISYAQRITVEAAGGMSMFSSDGEVLTQISDDKARTDTTTNMKSKIASMFAGSGRSSNIVRLDKQLRWNLLPEKRQYTETTFAEARAQLEQAMQSMEQARSSGGSPQALPVSAEGCQWNKGDLQVEHPGDKEKIADIKTEKHIVRLRQSCTDPDTGKTCDITWVMETWLAKKVPAEKEARKFQQSYAQAMGMDDVARQVQGPGQSLLSMFSSNWDNVVDELEKMKGYPMRTVMQMGIGGDECTTASGQPIAMDEIWVDASTAAYNAALQQTGREAGSAVGQAAAESLGDSVGGAIGGAAVGAAAREIFGGLTTMFKKEKQAKPAAQATSSGQQITAFRITTEVTKWSEITIPDDRFDEPVGWKKLARK